MRREDAIALMERAITVAENQVPEMAETHMEVPLDYFRDEEFAAKERALFETSPLALVASVEIADPHDYLVRNAVGRSVLITRDEHGVARAFLNYCRHRGAEVAQGAGNARRFTCPYHAWVYDACGHVVGMPSQDRHDGFDLSSYGLVCPRRHLEPQPRVERRRHRVLRCHRPAYPVGAPDVRQRRSGAASGNPPGGLVPRAEP